MSLGTTCISVSVLWQDRIAAFGQLLSTCLSPEDFIRRRRRRCRHRLSVMSGPTRRS